MHYQQLLSCAIDEARRGLHEGGIPVGAVLADSTGKITARGHNLRVQAGDPTAHAETVCIRNAGRRRDWPQLTLISTLSPCVMCTGTTLLFHIPKVIIGENQNFKGSEDLFRQYGVNLILLNDPDCILMMSEFISAHPEVWNEDIGNGSEAHLCAQVCAEGGYEYDKDQEPRGYDYGCAHHYLLGGHEGAE